MRSTYLTSLEHLRQYFPYSVIKINKIVLFWIKNYNVPSEDSKILMAFLSLGIVSRSFLWPRNRKRNFQSKKTYTSLHFLGALWVDTHLNLTTCKNMLLQPLVAEFQTFFKKSYPQLQCVDRILNRLHALGGFTNLQLPLQIFKTSWLELTWKLQGPYQYPLGHFFACLRIFKIQVK